MSCNTCQHDANTSATCTWILYIARLTACRCAHVYAEMSCRWAREVKEGEFDGVRPVWHARGIVLAVFWGYFEVPQDTTGHLLNRMCLGGTGHVSTARKAISALPFRAN